MRILAALSQSSGHFAEYSDLKKRGDSIYRWPFSDK